MNYYNKKILQDLISQGLTQRQIADKLNTSQSTVGRYIKKYKLPPNLPSKHKFEITSKCINCGKPLLRNGGKYCSSKCQNKYQWEQFVKEVDTTKVFKKGIYLRSRGKRYLIEKRGHQCEICKLSEWNKKTIVLETDHINGLSEDNRLENLRLLCPNCHSQTDNYKGKNKKSDRRWRKKYYRNSPLSIKSDAEVL